MSTFRLGKPGRDMSTFRLVSSWSDRQQEAKDFLWDLLTEREPHECISHKEMPSREDHDAFVEAWFFKYRFYYLIEHDGEWVGALNVTNRGELGIQLLKRFQGMGLGSRALEMFMARHSFPVVANINPANHRSQAFFAKHGFKPLKVVYERETNT